MPPDRQSGFTLIELMVTIAVLAVLLAWGLPNFQNSLRSNRVATSTNEVLASVLELGQRPLLSMFLIVFAAFLWLGYVVVDIWVDGLALRLKQRQGLQTADDR